MGENYSPATVTPLLDIKSEASSNNKVNGYPTSSLLTNSNMIKTESEANNPGDKSHQPQPYWVNRDQQQCCLVDNGRRCHRVAGNASYSKRIQKTVAQKKLRLHMDNSANQNYICDHHKNVIQSLRTKRKRKDSEEDSGETDSEHPDVDLYQLQVNTLRRYKKHFKVPSRPGLNKAQLADNLTRHFKTIPVVEKEALTYFIYMIKTNKSKLDQEHRREDD